MKKYDFDLVYGEIYAGYTAADQGPFIFTAYKDNIGFLNYIHSSNKFFQKANSSTFEWSRVEVATPDEKKHLQLCIAKGYYVSFNEVVQNKNLVNDFPIY